MSMELKEIVKTIKETEKLANTEIETVPPAGRPGIQMAIKQAKVSLPRLFNQYADALFAKSLILYPVGDKDKQVLFAQLANKVGKTITCDGDALYEYLTDRVEPSMGNRRQFTVNQLLAVDHALKGICTDLNLNIPQMPTLKGLPDITDHSGLVQYVKHLVILSNGYDVTIPYLRDLIYKSAYSSDFSNKVLTVVMLNTIGTDQSKLSSLFIKSVVVNLNQEVTEEFVTKTIKDAFKTK